VSDLGNSSLEALETGERFADVVQVLQAALRPFQFSNAVISPGDIGASVDSFPSVFWASSAHSTSNLFA